MKKANHSIGAIAGCVLLIGAGCVFAQDWPQWRGANRDGKVAGFTAPATWPKTLTPKWKKAVGLGDSTPALVGDRLYVFARDGNDEVTLCLDATNGKELWRDKYAAQAVTGAASRHPGPRSSPAVADGKVVTLGVGGVVSCLNAADGKLIWRKDEFPKVVPKFFTAVSPIIVDGMVIAHVGKEGNGAIVAFDLATGDVKWKWAGEGPAYSSPVVLTVDGTKQIVEMTEKSVVGVGAADGKLLWSVPFPVSGMSYNAATPIVDGQTVIYTGQGRGTHAIKIEKQGDGFAAKELWSNPQLGAKFNSPLLKDGKLYGSSDKGNFFCIDAQTGKPVWTDTARHGDYGAMLDAGSVILALPENSELVVFNASDAAYKEVAHIKIADTSTYASPVVAGNKIFVKDKDSVAMLTIE